MPAFRPFTFPIVAAFSLAACSTQVSTNQMVISADEGTFSGSAGTAWTPEEILDSVTNDACGGAAPTDLDIRLDGTNYTFSGTC